MTTRFHFRRTGWMLAALILWVPSLSHAAPHTWPHVQRNLKGDDLFGAKTWSALLLDGFDATNALCGDDKYLYAEHSGGIRRYNLDGGPAPFKGGVGPQQNDFLLPMIKELQSDSRKLHLGISSIAVEAKKKRLYVSVTAFNEENLIAGDELRAYDTSDGLRYLYRLISAGVPSLAIAPDGVLWSISSRFRFVEYPPPARLATTKFYEQADGSLPSGFQGEGSVYPVFSQADNPIALDFDDAGHLLVADGRPDQPIRIYDVSKKPKLVGTMASAAPSKTTENSGEHHD